MCYNLNLGSPGCEYRQSSQVSFQHLLNLASRIPGIGASSSQWYPSSSYFPQLSMKHPVPWSFPPWWPLTYPPLGFHSTQENSTPEWCPWLQMADPAHYSGLLASIVGIWSKARQFLERCPNYWDTLSPLWNSHGEIVQACSLCSFLRQPLPMKQVKVEENRNGDGRKDPHPKGTTEPKHHSRFPSYTGQ